MLWNNFLMENVYWGKSGINELNDFLIMEPKII